jgi:hypothetical protein
MRLILRVLLFAWLLAPLGAGAQGYIARLLNHPVPGGVAVVPLGGVAAGASAFLKDRQVMILRDSDESWIAVVGIDLKTRTGREQIELRMPDGKRRMIALSS